MNRSLNTLISSKKPFTILWFGLHLSVECCVLVLTPSNKKRFYGFHGFLFLGRAPLRCPMDNTALDTEKRWLEIVPNVSNLFFSDFESTRY